MPGAGFSSCRCAVGAPWAPCLGHMAGGCSPSLRSPALLLLLGPLSGPVTVSSSGGRSGWRSCFSPSVRFTGCPCSLRAFPAPFPLPVLPSLSPRSVCRALLPSEKPPHSPRALVRGPDFLGSSPPAGIRASLALPSLWGRWRISFPGLSSFLGSE